MKKPIRFKAEVEVELSPDEDHVSAIYLWGRRRWGYPGKGKLLSVDNDRFRLHLDCKGRLNAIELLDLPKNILPSNVLRQQP